MSDATITLTSAQIRELQKIVDEHDPCMVDICDTNLHNVVFFQFRADATSTQMEQVLVNADGVSMVM